MSFRNLSKTFRYVNQNGGEVVFEYDHGYLINKPVGIDTLQVNLSQAQGIDQIGSTVQSKTVQPRPVTISGILVGGDQSARKERLLSVIRPDLTGRLYADDYFLDVVVTATPAIEARPEFARFQFSLNAPYPYWQCSSTVSQALAGLERLFKFPWNISRPYRFGRPSPKQFVAITNFGQVPVPFRVTLTAKARVVSPKIVNVETGAWFLINKDLESGERIVVDITHERTYVTSSVDGSIRGALDLDSSLFRLNVGDNVLKPEAQYGIDQLEVEISFAPEITGVAL